MKNITGTTPAARLIDVRLWAKREAVVDLKAFGRLLYKLREQMVDDLRRDNAKALDALAPEERETLYQSAWVIYNEARP